MAAYSKLKLSGSTDGRMVLVVATATLGTTIHTASSTATVLDEIWLWAVNADTTARKLTIEFGGVTAPADIIEFTVPAEDGLYQLVPGLVLVGNATPLVVTAFCASASVVSIGGYVNRIT